MIDSCGDRRGAFPGACVSFIYDSIPYTAVSIETILRGIRDENVQRCGGSGLGRGVYRPGTRTLAAGRRGERPREGMGEDSEPKHLRGPHARRNSYWSGIFHFANRAIASITLRTGSSKAVQVATPPLIIRGRTARDQMHIHARPPCQIPLELFALASALYVYGRHKSQALMCLIDDPQRLLSAPARVPRKQQPRTRRTKCRGGCLRMLSEPHSLP